MTPFAATVVAALLLAAISLMWIGLAVECWSPRRPRPRVVTPRAKAQVLADEAG